ncbi:MAG: NAD(P)H-hydrate dehydratase [bacterium]
MKVVTSAEMKEIEKRAGEMGISPILLMENAAIAVTSYILQVCGDIRNKTFAVLCGPGNNGGDGFAVARHLYNKGAVVKVLFFVGKGKLTEETLANYDIVKKMGISLVEVEELSSEVKNIIIHSNFVVDAIFGTGLSRKVSGIFADTISFLNKQKKTVFAVDIPSGINADTGEVMGEAVFAAHTVALGCYKFGHLLFPGRAYCGNVYQADISLPLFLVEKTAKCEKVEEEKVKTLLRKRKANSHKGQYGHLVLVGGSPGKTGAIVMASKAAMRAGSGLATIVCPHSLNSCIENATLEVMTFPAGDINGYLSFAAVELVKQFLSEKDAVVIGPGLSANEITEEFFVSLMNGLAVPLVIDADGINLLAKSISVLKNVASSVVLTPHIGEMARLINESRENVIKNSVAIARDFAVKEGVFLVLKSATTVFATPEGEVFISTYGSAGMATAGTGDLLAGLLGGFLAQGYDTKSAVLLGLVLHGVSGQLACNALSDTALMATDILNYVPQVLKKWEDIL